MRAFVAVIHETSPFVDLEPLTIKDLKGENFIGFNKIRGAGYCDIVRQHCRAAGFPPKIVQRVSHTTGLVTLVAAGLGVGIVPAWVVNEPIRGGVLPQTG
ncbi:MAG: LysR family substrate-binding domain-containing protein [Hyphomicrobiales bacterium]